MEKDIITQSIAEAVAQRGCFLVEVTLQGDNDIVLAIESEHGTVAMEDCVAISDKFQELFNKDAEDYSLTVTSAGLDRPFKVLKQYEKAVGTRVVVRLKGGRKMTATLLAADEEGITISWQAKENIAGKKKLVEHEENVPFPQVNSVTPYIDFK